ATGDGADAVAGAAEGSGGGEGRARLGVGDEDPAHRRPHRDSRGRPSPGDAVLSSAPASPSWIVLRATLNRLELRSAPMGRAVRSDPGSDVVPRRGPFRSAIGPGA